MTYYTSQVRTDGFGAQFQTIIYTILYCGFHGHTYLYTPINKMEHNYADDKMFIRNAEKCMGIADNYEGAYEVIARKEADAQISTMQIRTAINHIEADIEKYLYNETWRTLVANFWKGKDRNILQKYTHTSESPNSTPYSYTRDHPNVHPIRQVAIHIRRPNKTDNRIAGADTPIQYYVNVVKKICADYPTDKLMFHVYSQYDSALGASAKNNVGELDELSTFIESDETVKSRACIHRHIDCDVFETFVEMVAADILVTSASSFSYSAALLTEGAVYYMPFWHPPVARWIVCEK